MLVFTILLEEVVLIVLSQTADFCHFGRSLKTWIKKISLKSLFQLYLTSGLSQHSLHPPPHPLGDGWGAETGGTWVKSEFCVGIGNLGESDFFQIDLKTPCIKSSEYESPT